MKQYVLAFDANCSTCRKMAEKVESASKGKLDIRALGDPDISKRRRHVFGDNAPWGPTLLDVQDNRAWMGIGLARKLLAVLGLRDAWRVLRSIGLAENSQSEGSDANSLSHMGRARFLRASLAGGALALGAIVAPGLAGSAFAKVRNKDTSAFDSVHVEKLQGSELTATMQSLRNRPETHSLMATLDGSGRTPDPSEIDKGIGAYRHTLREGGTALVAVLPAEIGDTWNRFIMFTVFEQKRKPDVHTDIRQWRMEVGGSMYLEKASINSGKISDVAELRKALGGDPPDPCGGCAGTIDGERMGHGCGKISVPACAACVGCAATCATAETGFGLAACIACLGGCGGNILKCCEGNGGPVCIPCHID